MTSFVRPGASEVALDSGAPRYPADSLSVLRTIGVSLLAVLGGCGGSARPRPAPAAPASTCPVDHIETLGGGDLAAHPIDGFATLTTRERWLDACPRLSPWSRRCLELSTTREQLPDCSPDHEPWSRSHDFSGPPDADRKRFLACVAAATTRA